jgi:hypothetical protein
MELKISDYAAVVFGIGWNKRGGIVIEVSQIRSIADLTFVIDFSSWCEKALSWICAVIELYLFLR